MPTSAQLSAATVLVQAPGRINLIGEHTDYNDGFVLPAAVDKRLTLQLQTNGTLSTVHLTDYVGQHTFSFALDDFAPVDLGWPNYIMGVVHELQKLGANLRGFDATFSSDLPIGSGMSSSAALECSFAVGLNELFALHLDQWQLIRAAQLAEHNFVGVQCGIMDQFASVMGKKDHVMLLDCRSLAFEYLPLQMNHHRLLLLNTNVSHSLAASAYNTRRSECAEAVDRLREYYPGITHLRDVSLPQLEHCSSCLPESVYRRCRHVIQENQRVLAAAQALQARDFHRLGQQLYASHHSLQYDYEVSCEELDFLVAQTLDKDYVLGSRMMGGGFGGCTLNIVATDRVAEFVAHSAQAYRDRFAMDLTPIAVAIGDGASVVRRT